jgi:hypothetical protein
MAEIRETEVHRDADGRVIGYKERIAEHVDETTRRKRGKGFGWGLLMGALLIALAIVAYATSLGSFQQAGREADQAAAVIDEQTDDVVGAADEVLQGAADTAQSAANTVENETPADRTGDTRTN